MEPIREWMQQRLGFAPGIQDALVLPLLAFLLLWGLRETVLFIAWRFVDKEDRRKFWRQVSFYFMLIGGLAIFGGIWLTSLRRIARILGADTEPELRTVEPLLLGFVYAFLATATLCLFLRLLWLAYGVALRRLHAWAAGTGGVRYQKAVLLSQQRIRDLAIVVLRGVRILLVLVLLYFYVPLLLSFFPITGGWGGTLLEWVLSSTSDIGAAIIAYLPNLIYLALILLLVRYIMRFLSFLMGGVEKGDIVLPGFDPEWANPTYKLVRVVVALLTMVVCYPLLPGAGSEVFKGFSIFVGAMVTFGSTAVIGNVISGIVLTYTRSFRIGDRVKIGEATGDVLEKTLFVTRVRTVKNEVITIPNGVVLGGRILNYTAGAEEQGLIVHTTVGIGYDVDWRRVHELLLGAAKKTELLLADPEPFVWQQSLDDYAVAYELNAYTNSPKQLGAIYSELRLHILDAFNAAGIEIMTPSVSALRDANQPAIPPDHAPKAASFPGFRFLDPNR
jgi:small-conductance mechanosensitive channel